MNIGIVTVWDERGAGYVSKVYKDYLSNYFNVFIYNRGYSKNKLAQDKYVYNSKKVSSIKPMSINKNEFKTWIFKNDIDILIFNEQQSWEPILWCKEWKIKTVAYIDFYTEETIKLHDAYDMVICNTKRHLEAFLSHHNPIYLKWGTDLEIYKPNIKINETPVFLHSCGYAPSRKGTEIVIKSFLTVKCDFKLIIQTQIELNSFFKFHDLNVERLLKEGKLEIVNETIPAPGLYYLADYYLYPTKLEGIGLTILESISSGLLAIIPDHPPMNEFVPLDYKYKINILRHFSRSDGYYWPQIEVSQSHFDELIIELITNHKNHNSNYIREWAEKNFNINTNFKRLELVLNELNYKQIDPKVENLIIQYENKRPINHEKINSLINPIIINTYKILKYLRWN